MKILKNNFGLSLIELLVGVGLSTIATLACFTLINQSYSNYVASSNTTANIIETVGAAATLRQILSSAVNITSNKNLPIVANFSKKKGYVREYSLDDWLPSSGDGKIETLFTGFVDQIKSSEVPARDEVDLANRFLPISVFFQRPTVNKYGVIYMAIGKKDSKSLKASDAQFQMDQIVDLKIADIEVPFSDTNKVSRFTILITRRNFKNLTAKSYMWCPPQFISDASVALCKNPDSHFDTSEFINVLLRNNKLRESTSQKQLKPLATSAQYIGIPERFQTGVYFFKPKISWDTLKR